jgi:hypothetical protein
VDNELIYLGTALGIILGGLVGAVIGLVVALRNAGARGGLVLGSIAGVALAIYLFRGTGPYDDLIQTANAWESWAIIATGTSSKAG